MAKMFNKRWIKVEKSKKRSGLKWKRPYRVDSGRRNAKEWIQKEEMKKKSGERWKRRKKSGLKWKNQQNEWIEVEETEKNGIKR